MVVFRIASGQRFPDRICQDYYKIVQGKHLSALQTGLSGLLATSAFLFCVRMGQHRAAIAWFCYPLLNRDQQVTRMWQTRITRPQDWPEMRRCLQNLRAGTLISESSAISRGSLTWDGASSVPAFAPGGCPRPRPFGRHLLRGESHHSDPKGPELGTTPFAGWS